MKSKKLGETGGFVGINKPYSGVDKYQSVPTKNVQIDNIIEDLLTLEDSIEQTNTNISNLSKENIAGLQLDDSPEFRKVVLRTTTKDSSTNAIEVYDSDGTLIFSTDSRGFSTKIFYRDEYVGGPWTEASGAAAISGTNTGATSGENAVTGSVGGSETDQTAEETAGKLYLAAYHNGEIVNLEQATDDAADLAVLKLCSKGQ